LIKIHLAGLAARDDVVHRLIVCPYDSWGSEGRFASYSEELGGCDRGGVTARGWGFDCGARSGLPTTRMISERRSEREKPGTETGGEHWGMSRSCI